tara:strand:+ start:10985 stop:11656 length:672 start_codon:yes stop_codon:yes gene_type:complete
MAISTNSEMRDKIRQIIDREDTAYFSDTQIDEYVEMATDEFLQQYYSIFEANQDARDKLDSLVITVDATSNSNTEDWFISTSSLSTSGQIFYQGNYLLSTTPTDLNYYRLLSARLKNLPSTSIKIIQLSDYTAYTNDPFNVADANNPVLFQEGGKLNILGILPSTEVDLTFLMYTTNFLRLSYHTYEEISQIASRKILQTLGDPRYPLMQAEVLERNRVLGGK